MAAEQPPAAPLITVRGACYTYPESSAPALADIRLDVYPGDHIAILGANGSGKSTLSRLVAGFFEPDSGSVDYAPGTDGTVPVGIVFQQPKEQIVAGVVERDTAFGPQNLGADDAEVELRTMECLSLVSLADRAFSRTFELSLGQTQRLALSGILALFPTVLLLDEVTAMLDPEARAGTMRLLEQWNARGHTILHITHDREEALRARRIVVLEKGCIRFDGTRDAFLQDGALDRSVFGGTAAMEAPSPHPAEAEPALVVRGLSFAYPGRTVFSGVSFTLRTGTLTALTGPSGCGKSTLFECLAALKAPSAGSIACTGRPALALQEAEAALFARSAADDVAFGPQKQGLHGKELVRRVRDAMNLVGLDYEEFADRATFSLSGGEKRKLSLAGIIALGSDVLIFDEPTAGLDPASRRTVLAALRALADSGKTVLFSTHRPEEAEGADRHLSWQELMDTARTEAPPAPQSDGLAPLRPLPAVTMLDGLQKTGAALMAPPHIPPSPVSRMPPPAKLLVLLGLFAAIIAVRSLPGCAVLCALSLAYALLARYPPAKPLAATVRVLPWFLVLAVLQLMFYTTAGDTSAVLFRWQWVTVTAVKARMVLSLFLRLPCILTVLGTFLFTTGERQIMDGMAALLKPLALLHVPVRYAVLATGIMFRFLPLLMDELSGIIKTQLVRGAVGQVRGLGKLRLLVPLFVPLMLQTFRKAQALADALTARNFH